MEEAFHQWLDFAGERAGLIFLNGDLFDFWFEWGSVVPSGHARILGTLARIADSGVPIHLMGGNHDWWGGRYLTEEIGLTIHKGEVRLRLAGYRCLIAHGDGLGGGDLGYRILKQVLRGRLTQQAFRWVHPDIATAIARRVSRTDSESDDETRSQRAAALERWARERLLADTSLDLVILGHCHLPERVEVAPGRFYLNAGDWLTHGTYVVLENGSAPIVARWNGPEIGEPTS